MDFVLYADADPTVAPDAAEIGREATAWLFSDVGEEVDEEGRYAFCYLCELMGLETSFVRRLVLTLDSSEYRKVIRRTEV